MAINEEVARIMMHRFGLQKLTLDNIEEVYNPLVSGQGNMAETRAYLIQRGMNAELADTLAKRYLNKLETQGQIFSLMDLFESSKNATPLNTLMSSTLSQVHFSY